MNMGEETHTQGCLPEKSTSYLKLPQMCTMHLENFSTLFVWCERWYKRLSGFGSLQQVQLYKPKPKVSRLYAQGEFFFPGEVRGIFREGAELLDGIIQPHYALWVNVACDQTKAYFYFLTTLHCIHVLHKTG